MRIATFVAALFICWGQVSLAAHPDLSAETFARLLPDMASPDAKVCAAAQQKWQEICTRAGAPGNEASRAEACKLMAERLNAETPAMTRIWLLKQLELIGREECVDAVAAQLGDKNEQVRDAALRCLAENPAPQATAKLSAQLAKERGKAKVALLNALGHRRDQSATPSVAKQLSNQEEEVALAAAQALGRFGSPEAAKALSVAQREAKGKVHLALCHALLACADQHRQAGRTDEAREIYKGLAVAASSKPYRPIRSAAQLGLIRCAGDGAAVKIQEMLESGDEEDRAIAVGEIANLNPVALSSLAVMSDKLPVSSRVLVIDALAVRGDKSQSSVALAAAKSKDDVLRRAGIRALGRLGDVSAVQVLIEALDNPNLQGAAVSSLAQLNAEGVDTKLIAALERGGVRDPRRAPSSALVALIEVVERRRSAEAVPTLLKAAKNREGQVRVSAFSALRGLAGAQHVPDLVKAMLELKPGAERDAAEACIVAVSAKIVDPDKRATAVLAVMKEKGESQRRVLLPLLGRLGGSQAREEIEKSLQSNDRETFAAAAQALCRWPDASASDKLLGLAQNSDWKTSAIRALVRINTLKDNRPADQKLAALKRAMKLAENNGQRRLILEGLGTVRHIDTFRFVVPYLDDKELTQSACKALVGLARSTNLHHPHREEVDKVLDRVISISRDKVLIDLAKQYKQRVPSDN